MEAATPPECRRISFLRRPSPAPHLLSVDPTMRTNIALTPLDLGAKGPKALNFSINCGALGRAQHGCRGREQVPTPLPILRHLSPGQLQRNDLQPLGVFQQERGKCRILWNTNCTTSHGKQPRVTLCRPACLRPCPAPLTLFNDGLSWPCGSPTSTWLQTVGRERH